MSDAIYYMDKANRLERQLNKIIEILGSSLIDICPNEFGLSGEDACPKHMDCQRCWEDGLKTIK